MLVSRQVFMTSFYLQVQPKHFDLCKQGNLTNAASYPCPLKRILHPLSFPYAFLMARAFSGVHWGLALVSGARFWCNRESGLSKSTPTTIAVTHLTIRRLSGISSLWHTHTPTPPNCRSGIVNPLESWSELWQYPHSRAHRETEIKAKIKTILSGASFLSDAFGSRLHSASFPVHTSFISLEWAELSLIK